MQLGFKKIYDFRGVKAFATRTSSGRPRGSPAPTGPFLIQGGLRPILVALGTNPFLQNFSITSKPSNARFGQHFIIVK